MGTKKRCLHCVPQSCSTLAQGRSLLTSGQLWRNAKNFAVDFLQERNFNLAKFCSIVYSFTSFVNTIKWSVTSVEELFSNLFINSIKIREYWIIRLINVMVFFVIYTRANNRLLANNINKYPQLHFYFINFLIQKKTTTTTKIGGR